MSDIYKVLDFAFDLLNTRLTFAPFSFTIHDFFCFLILSFIIASVIHSIFD